MSGKDKSGVAAFWGRILALISLMEAREAPMPDALQVVGTDYGITLMNGRNIFWPCRGDLARDRAPTWVLSQVGD